MDVSIDLCQECFLLDRPAGQGCAEGWRKVVSPLDWHRGKNGTFSEKNDKKGSQNGVNVYHSLVGDIEVFASFSGIPENPR